MGADTWVQHRLPAPSATTPPKKPERKAVAAPTSPNDGQKSEYVSRKEFGWFWITRKRNGGPLTFTRPSLDAGTGAASQAQRVEEGPSLSRVSSGDSWLEVTRDNADAGGSSEDLTDLEDTNLVSVAPRPEPRVRSIRVRSVEACSTAPSIGRCNVEDSEAAPAGSLCFDSSDAPEPSSMHRDCDECDEQQAPVGIRMRPIAVKDKPTEQCTQVSRAASSNGLPGDADINCESEGTLSMARVAAACGVAPDSDLLWTFLAGMMLYFMSV